MNSRTIWLLALLLAVLPLTGCYHWHVPETGPRASIRDSRPSQVRVTVREADEPMTLGAPILRGDSVLGNDPTEGVAIRDIERLEVRRFDTGGTVKFAVAITAASLVLQGLLGSLDFGGGSSGSSGTGGPFGCWFSC